MNNTILEESFLNEEYRNNFRVSVKRKKVWGIEIACFRQFKRICERHNLKYYLIGGSLLGAIRHGGFIPWDDDMDVAMMRSDYNYFLDIATKELCPPFCLQATGCDNEFYCGFSRICHSESTALLNGQWSSKTKRNCGIFLDIFPLDAVPKNKLTRLVHKGIGRLLTVTANTSILNLGYGIKNFILRRLLRLFPVKLVAKYRDKWVSIYNSKSHNEVGIISMFYNQNRWIWDKSLFSDAKPCKFEFESAMIPNGWEEILKKTYGDWRIPIKGGSCHEACFYDPDRPYTYYISQYAKFNTVTVQNGEW